MKVLKRGREWREDSQVVVFIVIFYRSYSSLMQPDKMRSNKDVDSDASDDFM